ncbi:hypothetical protein GOP47_0000890 [Adiantum capillus-veneris]|uniref:ABC transporter domain-containing protein n=1 Tax=Adiantum capillus-veneris TaxID=13818 RepID=A0A9D4VDU4_ADICA|nr:hypothetical protein GOP47_0000890 [Adiantum capillus-veneris]
MALGSRPLCSQLAGLQPHTFRNSPHKFISSIRGSIASEVKIKVHNLWKKGSNGEKILEGISFDVRQGGVHALIGPSGSGKSTVLRALNRLWEPPPSSIFLNGQDVTVMDAISLRRRVGMLFQTSHLFPGTVADNVKYGPSLIGKQLSTNEIENLLSLAGFPDLDPQFLDKSVNELSGGEAQRVALARALANKPEVLLLDEPTSSLDPVSTRSVENTVMQLVQSGDLTVVIVSHSLEQIGRLAGDATVLYQGSLLETGPFSELSKEACNCRTHDRSGCDGSCNGS